MNHPHDYTSNEAWIVFRLNSSPVKTQEDGDFNVVCLMDAASCYMLGNELFDIAAVEVPAPIAERLIETGEAVANTLPRKLLLSSALGTAHFAELAKRSGIEAQHLPDNDLKPFISEARQAFTKHTQGT